MSLQFNKSIIIYISLILCIIGISEGYILHYNNLIQLNIQIFYFILIKCILNILCGITNICFIFPSNNDNHILLYLIYF